MKQLILFKQSKSIQLGHLYEHIFYAHIISFFRKNHLYQRLDYSLSGETYHHGVIFIIIELYTKAAVELSNYVPELNVEFNQTNISIAATQLLAEKERPFGGAGLESVQHALQTLHTQPWQSIDEIRIIDTKTIRKTAYPFYIAEGKPLPSKKLTVLLKVDPEFMRSRRELLPLFREVAWLIIANLQDTLADRYGYFSLADNFMVTKHKMYLANTFQVAHTNEAHMEECLKTSLEIIKDLQTHKGFTRYVAELQNISYTNRPNLAPNLQKNLKDTLIVMGARGWHEIATAENCELILGHMSIGVQFGRHKLFSPLSAACAY